MDDINKALQQILETISTANETKTADMTDEDDPLYAEELESIVGPLNVKLSSAQYTILAVYLTLVGITATCCNSIVLIVLLNKRTFQKRAVNILLVNIAVSDLAISFCGYPLFTASNYAGRWITGVAGCKLSGFMVYFFSCVTIGTYAYIACYRYIYVCKPNTRPRLTPRFTGFILLFIWVFSFIWTVAPLLGWSRYVLEPFGTSCSIDWSSDTISNTLYQWLSCVFFYFMPLSAIIYSYSNVIKYTAGVDPHKVAVHAAGGGAAEQLQQPQPQQHQSLFFKLRKKETQIDFHVTKMCILMTMVFLTAWTPYCVESLWAMHQTEISVIAAVMPTMCCKASPMLNPLVLILSSSDFRDDCKKLFPCLSSDARNAQVLSVHRHTERRRSQSSTYYIRECDGVGRQDDAAAVYFNKERVFIGHVRTESIDTESTILKKDYNQRRNLHLSIDHGDTDPEGVDAGSKSGGKLTVQRDAKRGGGRKGKKRIMPGVLPKRIEPESLSDSRPSTC